MSNELIKVVEENGEILVSGRELHEFLELKTPYKDWFPRMVEYGFVENQDFVLVAQKRATNNPKNPTTMFKDHSIKIDMAKEVSMIQRNEKGKQARQYFIECEKKLKANQSLLPNTYKEALLQLVAQVEQNEILELENKQQKQIIMEYTPKATYYDEVLKSVTPITITQIAKDYGITAQEMNKKLHDLKVQFKQSGVWLLYDKYADKGYTKSETTYFTKPNKETGTSIQTKWTQKGRLFIYDLFKNNNILPVIEQVV